MGLGKCGHVGCEKEITECHGHVCLPFYRSRLTCEELSELFTEWARTHPKDALVALADSGVSWAVEQRNESRVLDMKVGSL